MHALNLINPIDLVSENACGQHTEDYFKKVLAFDSKTLRIALDNGFIKIKECEKCKKTTNLILCSRCKEVWYCSKKCQKEAQKTHEAVCCILTLERLVKLKCVPSWIADSVVPYYIQFNNPKPLFKDKDMSSYMYDKSSNKKTFVFLSTYCNQAGHTFSPFLIPFILVPVQVEDS